MDGRENSWEELEIQTHSIQDFNKVMSVLKWKNDQKMTEANKKAENSLPVSNLNKRKWLAMLLEEKSEALESEANRLKLVHKGLIYYAWKVVCYRGL